MWELRLGHGRERVCIQCFPKSFGYFSNKNLSQCDGHTTVTIYSGFFHVTVATPLSSPLARRHRIDYCATTSDQSNDWVDLTQSEKENQSFKDVIPTRYLTHLPWKRLYHMAQQPPQLLSLRQQTFFYRALQLLRSFLFSRYRNLSRKKTM